jgi:hypothetical protein
MADKNNALKLDGKWVAKFRELVAGLLANCYGSFMGSNPDISKKYKMGELSKGVANTL